LDAAAHQWNFFGWTRGWDSEIRQKVMGLAIASSVLIGNRFGATRLRRIKSADEELSAFPKMAGW
jgi:hypothetical protein